MKKYIICDNCKEVVLIEENQALCTYCKANLSLQECTALKALSIRQPWARLIVNGHKDIENRDTLKNFRGHFLIHASTIFDKEWESKLDFNLNLQYESSDLKTGGIIGAAKIVDSVTKSSSPWFIGKYGFVIEDSKNLHFQKCKGKLGFFTPEIF